MLGSFNDINTMQKIDLFKLETLFETFSGRPVSVVVVGTVRVPFFVNDFSWWKIDNGVCFAENDNESVLFCIDYDTVLEILNGYDCFGSVERVLIRCQVDIFVTYYEVCCEYN